ncbi:MAG TPA: hypothetical protein VGA69_05930 [Nitriliruptorales bacterium]
MAKALMGSFAAPKTILLLDEVRSLRQRVAQLEAALAAAERARDARDEQDHVVAIDTAQAVSA